jgi:hypothetical protein
VGDALRRLAARAGGVIGDVEVRPAGAKGLGAFARRDFGPGEFIFRRRQSRPFPNARITELSEDDQRHLCEIDFERSAVLLPPGCYLNHSCEPNAMRSGVKVFAWRPIARGDEITIDYRLNAFGDETSECLCGAPSCPGRVTWSFFALDPATQEAYLPYAPRFIRRELRRHDRAL